MNILVTGANGFVGSSLLHRLSRDIGCSAIGMARKLLPGAVSNLVVDDLVSWEDCDGRLKEVDAIVHCAARVHVMQDAVTDPLSEFRRVNVDGTLNLARQAVDAGVKRFIYISSVKVNGEATDGEPFGPYQTPHPQDPYGISKQEAEEGLHVLARATGLEVVIIRPPMVYGPGVKGNFRSMMKAVQYGIPLPLGSVQNMRSLVALDNLVDLIKVCLVHPDAPGNTFMVSDGEDISTAELLRKIAGAFHRRSMLFPSPQKWLSTTLSLLGYSGIAERLCGSLQVDISHTENVLGWSPVVTMEEQLMKMADEFQS